MVSKLFSKVINVLRKAFYLNSHQFPAKEVLDFSLFLPLFFHSSLEKLFCLFVCFLPLHAFIYYLLRWYHVNCTIRYVRQHEVLRLRTVGEYNKSGLSISKLLWLKWKLYGMSKKRVYN